ncbi:MAG TPA: hypothetical protein PKD53_14905 [Chloroflexaceae bacterium]|nr:hypothetical protein [Chloroflexaceae bacterium]
MWRWVAIAFGTLVVLLIAFIVGMYLAPVGVREATRDIFIIILGVFQLITAVLLAALLFAIIYAVNQINKVASGTVIPKLDEAMVKMNDVLDSTRTIAGNARETASNVSGSTSFVTERVVSPIIRVSSLFTGVRAAATSLARRDAADRLEQELRR